MQYHLGLRVLLVEDNPLVATAIEDVLAEAGHSIVEPFRASAGAPPALPKQLDVALLDVSPHGGSSFEFAAELGNSVRVRQHREQGIAARRVSGPPVSCETLCGSSTSANHQHARCRSFSISFARVSLEPPPAVPAARSSRSNTDRTTPAGCTSL